MYRVRKNTSASKRRIEYKFPTSSTDSSKLLPINDTSGSRKWVQNIAWCWTKGSHITPPQCLCRVLVVVIHLTVWPKLERDKNEISTQYRILPVTSFVNTNRYPNKTFPSQGRYKWYDSLVYFCTFILLLLARDSCWPGPVGIATDYGLDGPG
jgi:hypothetical protein